MIEVQNLTKRYGSLTALQGLSLRAEAGSVYGLVGYNGAGKTTLLKCAMGIYKPEEGRVTVDGEDVYDNANRKRDMFLVPDEPFFLPQATLARMARFYRGFYPRWNQGTFDKLTGVFHLDADKRLHGFSKGMQKQASIILALSTHPKVLLLDELFDGLDPVMRNLVRQLVMELIGGSDTAVILSSHNLRELEDLCDHIGVINHQHIVYDNTIYDLRRSRCQYRVVLSADAQWQDFAALPCANLKLSGRVLTFLCRGQEEAIDSQLAQFAPALVEKLPLTLEELFLDEMEVGEYDFSGIFDGE